MDDRDRPPVPRARRRTSRSIRSSTTRRATRCATSTTPCSRRASARGHSSSRRPARHDHAALDGLRRVQRDHGAEGDRRVAVLGTFAADEPRPAPARRLRTARLVAMEHRPLGTLSVSELGYGAWGIGGHGGSAPTTTSRCARCPRDRARRQLHRHGARLRRRSQRAARRPAVPSRGDVYVATKIPPKNRAVAAPPGVTLEEAFPATGSSSAPSAASQPRARDDRRAAVPRLVRRVGRAGRLARGGRAS